MQYADAYTNTHPSWSSSDKVVPYVDWGDDTTRGRSVGINEEGGVVQVYVCSLQA